MNHECGDMMKKVGEMTMVPLLTGCLLCLVAKVARWVEL